MKTKNDFTKTDASIVCMDSIWQFSYFLKLRHFFWTSIKSHKLEFKVILSLRLSCKKFSFIDQMIVCTFAEFFMLFAYSEKKIF